MVFVLRIFIVLQDLRKQFKFSCLLTHPVLVVRTTFLKCQMLIVLNILTIQKSQNAQ